ncbi:hypothetical protein PUNSTDRAFT_72547 [Punctularia strigosozonata HHB-11173 SS5]|uniref:uncharacterized protein n=1 Tax=Punctularia strigosozonata (strain HHB-11173) TaxID=741275 RepID=UPI0004417BE2|nr:uncharacterized protein PUNSTDRAFT_72547 [Punctularia strigosozonata HHB-11173 SS5]EIN06806.1 hypothetical protein PUNSTDRAFT_72547 [Punctularia strigosozonata HHB-11173 SS5]
MITRHTLPAYLELAKQLYPPDRIPRSTHTLQQLDPHTILKTGFSHYILREAEALAFVRANTSIPVPCVYDRAWPAMTQAAQDFVVAQLRAYLAELRALKQPDGPWIGSCSGGPGADHRIRTRDGSFPRLPSVAAFHDLLHQRIKAHRPGPYYDSIRRQYKDDYPIVFSHADFNPANIMVDPSTGRVTAIVDWEMAGWWPAYWEYRKALYGWNTDDPEWMRVVPQIMDVYDAEYNVDTTNEYA